MEDRIRQLDDPTALRVLNTIARLHAGEPGVETELLPPLRAFLAEESGIPLSGGAARARASTGDVAREALIVLAAEPQRQAALRALMDGPGTRTFDAGTTLAVTTAALIVLQVRFHIERGPNGRYKWSLDYKPSGALLKPLVDKLLSWAPDGPFGRR